jgi:hypothetical protein
MEPEKKGGNGLLGHRQAGDLARRGLELERVGAVAAQVLEDLYGLVYGERPVGVRVWCDGSALLMVVRLAGPADISEPELCSMLPCEGIPELIATAVRARTDWELAVGSSSVEADLGLVMFVFRVPEDGPPEHRSYASAASRALVATSAELEAGHAVRSRPATRIPSWRAWSPVPSGPIAPPDEDEPDRPRLRIVED